MTASTKAARLAVLLQLEQRLRRCDAVEALRFLLVNDTYTLTPYRQAVLWQRSASQPGQVTALSGLSVPDAHAPLNLWLAALLDQASENLSGPGPLEAGQAGTTQDSAMWQEHLPAHGWWLPLALGHHDEQAGLLLLREAPWDQADTALLDLLADAAGHAWGSRLAPSNAHRPWQGRSWRHRLASRKFLLLALIAAALLASLPVRQSVLAPAEVVAQHPVAIRAPLPGVVDRIAVTPNQVVQAGQLLVALDARELEGKLEAARQALAVAEAELRQGQQRALFDERSKAGLALLQGKYDQAATDVDYLASALGRTQMHAPRAGTVIVDHIDEWIGKPVATGERIMQIADPEQVELEIQLPLDDAISLPEQAEIRLFLNSSPAWPVPARLQRIAYRATPTADGTLAYKVRASLDKQQSPALRIGLKGTAKLYGQRTPLLVYILRRPLTTLRIWLGI